MWPGQPPVTTPVNVRRGPGYFWRYDAPTRLALLRQVGFNLPNDVTAAQKNDMLLLASRAYVNGVAPNYWNNVWAKNHPAKAVTVGPKNRGASKGAPAGSTGPPAITGGAGGGTTSGYTDPYAGVGFNYTMAPFNAPAGTSPATIQSTAKTIVDSILGGQQASLEALQKAAAARGTNAAELWKNFGLAQADVLKGVAPEVQGMYNTAATQSGSFAKGYSDAYQQAVGQNTSEANQLLTNRNLTPMDTGAAATAGGDVLFGLGGGLAAKDLVGQGAAYGAAAAQLPNAAIGSAKMQAAQVLAAGLQEAAQYDPQLADLINQRPGLMAQWINQLTGTADTTKKTAFDIWSTTEQLKQQAAKARYEAGATVAQGKVKAAQVDMQTANTLTKLFGYGVDPRTGKVQWTPEMQRYLLQEQKFKNKGKAGGLTAAQVQKLHQNAASDVEIGFNGDVKTNPDGTYTIVHQPMTYQQEILHLLRLNVPLSMAQQIMNTLWKRPGWDRTWTFNQDTGQFEFTWVRPPKGGEVPGGRPLSPYQLRAGK